MNAEEVLEILDRAVAANWTDPFREGFLVRLPAKGDVMFTGDLHGAMDNFALILKAADLDGHPDRHLILHEVVHQLELGRDESYKLIEKAAELKVRYPDRVHILLGNHDLAEVQGREIFKGGICLNLLFDTALEQAYGPAKMRVKTKLMEFIKTLPLAVQTPNRVFMAHSTPEAADMPAFSMDFFRRSPEPGDFQSRSLPEKLIWGRDYGAKAADAWAKIVDAEAFLVGHAPCLTGFNVPNHRHIVLDSKDSFATCLLFSLEHSVSHAELREKIRFLRPKAAAKVAARKG